MLNSCGFKSHPPHQKGQFFNCSFLFAKMPEMPVNTGLNGIFKNLESKFKKRKINLRGNTVATYILPSSAICLNYISPLHRRWHKNKADGLPLKVCRQLLLYFCDVV